MIQAAMMFALGFCVCGLIALAASSALARRTRRLAERRVKLRYATKRREFETERDELRARHAVEVQRLERNVRDTGDQATSYRLEAALKDIEINSLNSELDDKEEEIDDLNERLDTLHAQLRDTDRRLAESGTALRAARHNLQTKSAEDAPGDNPYTPVNGYHVSGEGSAHDGRPSPETENIEKVASEIHRISNETKREIRHLATPDDAGHPADWSNAVKLPPPTDPDRSVPPPPAAIAGTAEARLEMLDPPQREIPPAAPVEAEAGAAENRFFDAVDQLRTLKKAGRNAAE